MSVQSLPTMNALAQGDPNTGKNQLTHRHNGGRDKAVPDGDDADDGARVAASRPYRESPIGLMNLPPEILVQISQYLIYPDALELKHTNRFFFRSVYTGVRLKVEWLMLRRALHLDCPDTRCDLGSDVRFCRGSVPLLMKHRREHIECESRPGIGCLVFDTPKCEHQKPMMCMQRWLRQRVTVEAWACSIGGYHPTLDVGAATWDCYSVYDYTISRL